MGHSVLNLSNYPASPRFTFQPPFRQQSAPNVPGPGSYEMPQRNGRAALITETPNKGRLPLKPDEDKPGPGAHDIKTSMGTGPKHGFSLPLSSKGSHVPGPGSYETSSGIGNGKKYTVGLPRSSPRNKVPGPGAYDHDNYSKMAQNPQWSLVGGSPRNKPAKLEERPGPGAYPKPTKVGEGPKFSHGLPRKDKTEATPGPGAYGGLYTTFHT